MSSSKRNLVPRPRIDARTTAWLIEQRERSRALELEVARLQGRLDASESLERGSQRYADRLEDRLEAARKRESTLARAVGYLESQRDQLASKLGIEGTSLKRLRRRSAAKFESGQEP